MSLQEKVTEDGIKDANEAGIKDATEAVEDNDTVEEEEEAEDDDHLDTLDTL